MEILALAIASLSLLVAIVGTYLANARAKEALDLSRSTAVDTQWSAAQAAVQHLIGFDPSAEPIKDRLTNLRIATNALIDAHREWDGLDSWLEAERALGATFGLLVIETTNPTDGVEQRVEKLGPLMSWAQALSSNLRRLRSHGHDPAALADLESRAKELIVKIHKENGWNLPPDQNPRIRPL